MTTTLDGPAKVADLNAVYSRRLDEIRASAYDNDAKRVLMARAYRDIKKQAEQIRAEVERTTKAEAESLQRDLFGIDRFVSASSPDSSRASLAISFRDAQDRAAKLERPEQGLELLNRADRGGDEMLARAVVEHAIDHGWVDVLNAYADRRPGTEAKLQRLVDLNASGNAGITRAFRDEADFYVPPPLELGRSADVHTEQLAATHLQGIDS